MPTNPPGFLQGGTYTALLDRQYLITSIMRKDPADPSQAAGGLLPADENWSADDTVVGLQVTISPYRAIVNNTQAANTADYLVISTANEVVNLDAASPTLNRIDVVGIQVRDQFYAGTDNDSLLTVVKGTNVAGTPAVPAFPANFLPLWQYRINAGNTTPAVVTDLRKRTAPVGVIILPFSGQTADPGSYIGEIRLIPGTGGAPPYLAYWDGSNWINVNATPIVNVYTSSTNWSKPAGARYVKAQAQAAGGAGGGCGSTGSGEGAAGGGGGGGGYGESILSASALAASVAVTVGAGGTGVSNGAGNSGGASSFGAHVVAAGGSGGTALGSSGATVGAAAGGAGGTASAGQVTASGSAGGLGVRAPSGFSTSQSGPGGGSHLGGGGVSTVNSSGNAGLQYGGGGSGGANGPSTIARSGGAGAAGIVIVTTYF